MKKELIRIFISLMWVLALTFSGIATSYYLNEHTPISHNTITNIRLLSAVLIAWAVYARLYNFESYKGKTIAERLKKIWFISTYGLGYFGIILSLKLYANVAS